MRLFNVVGHIGHGGGDGLVVLAVGCDEAAHFGVAGGEEVVAGDAVRVLVFDELALLGNHPGDFLALGFYDVVHASNLAGPA